MGAGGAASRAAPSAALEAAAAATGAGRPGSYRASGASAARGPTLAEIAAGLDGFESPRD